MSCITVANMRKGVMLHKLILLELLLGIWHGFWIFFHQPIYGWWLSVSAIFLNISWSLHNVIAWMKIKPFLNKTASTIFIGTVILVQPYWVVEIYANFTYFHNINDVFLHTRPFEALCRDPWWIYTTVALFYYIKTRYELTIGDILRVSPRFGIMMGAMLLSICFIILDVCSITKAIRSSLPVGINPFWKLAFVFKCLTDSVILDDFKTALDRLRAFKISRIGSFSIDSSDRRVRGDRELENAWEAECAPKDAPNGAPPLPSPDGDYVQPCWHAPKDGPTHLERVHSNSTQSGESGTAGAGSGAFVAGLDRQPRIGVLDDPWETRGGQSELQGMERFSAESDYLHAIKEINSESGGRSLN